MVRYIRGLNPKRGSAMLVREIKEKLDSLGMEYEESWIPAYATRNLVKEVEVFFSEEQIAENGEGEATSMIFVGGWKSHEKRTPAWKEVEYWLKDIGIL